uniref:Uncharacterized protein n=5 Tax=Aegilops tauschii subsp. strangulata TaxID=200361 RepID=A0A453T277_AEGTS
PSSSPWSTQPSPLSIFSAPGLCRPLATPPPAARVSGRASPARLRRPQVRPSFLLGRDPHPRLPLPKHRPSLPLNLPRGAIPSWFCE